MLTANNLTVIEAMVRLGKEGYYQDENGIWISDEKPDSIALIVFGRDSSYFILWTTRESINY